MGFWRKWNMLCMMFVVSCLLATRFYKEVPGAVNTAENLMWVGGAGLVIGFIMLFVQSRRK